MSVCVHNWRDLTKVNPKATGPMDIFLETDVSDAPAVLCIKCGLIELRGPGPFWP